MTTQYIDVNCSQGVSQDNTTNNRWTYQVDEGMDLPTNTRVSVQSSFINKKGITGGSIQIDEDIEEVIMFNYYGVDTDYKTLIQFPQDPAATFNNDLFTNYSSAQNYDYASRDFKTGQENNTKWLPNMDRVGRSENRMPYCNFIKGLVDGSGAYDTNVIPMVGTATIKIPRGVYSVLSMAKTITDQLNGLAMPDNMSQNYIEFAKINQQWQGTNITNICNRVVVAEEPFINPLSTFMPTPNNPNPGLRPPLFGGPFQYWFALWENSNVIPLDNPDWN